MKKSEFIPTIAPIVQKVNKEMGSPLYPSVVISQAVCETGWGQSKLMMNANAIFGIKANANWQGKVYDAKTQECYDGKTFTTIKSCFRAYNNYEESIRDYFQLICKTARYKEALFTNSPKECIEEIKKGGYATDPQYVEKIISIIDINNLYKYDVENVENTVDNSKEIIDLNELAEKVIAGGFGNGKERKQRLGELYDAVQEIVNEKYDLDIKVGDKVEVLKNEQYNGKSFRVYYKVYNVIEIKGDKAVIGIDNIVTCAINIKNIRKVK